MGIRNLKIKHKLMLAFSMLAVVVLMVSCLAIVALGASNARFADYRDSVAQRERLATDIRGGASRRAIAARNLVLVTRPEDVAIEKAAVTKAHEDVGVALSLLLEAVKHEGVSAETRRMVGDIAKLEAQYGPVALSIVAMALEGKRDTAVQKMNAECRPLLAQLLADIHGFIARGQQETGDAAAASQAQFEQERLLLIGVAVAAIAASLVMGLMLTRSIVTPLMRAVTLAESVAEGDLSSAIVVDSSDETGQLLAALKKMNEGLVTMVGQVRLSADGIATASSEIASGNLDLSGRTEQQASALEQTAASMQEMTTTVQQNAGSAQQASELAGNAAEVAARGGEVVQRVVDTMGEISTASKKIADIIGTIDGIAFQTNILALNAAVEAARAGEQGRGFAVVASEVRSLAQRSAAAAKEIKGLIGASVDRVQAGSKLVTEAGSTMKDIVTQVQRVTDLMTEINASTSAQSSGISQVNTAVASLDQGTQQNAALVEQSAAAAESLRQQAGGLLKLIAAFKLSGQETSLA